MELQYKLRNLAKMSLVAASVGIVGMACDKDKTPPTGNAEDIKKTIQEDLGTYAATENDLYALIKVETYLKDEKGAPKNATENLGTDGKPTEEVKKQYALIFPQVARDRTKTQKGLIVECGEEGFGKAGENVKTPELYSEYAYYVMKASEALGKFSENVKLDAKAYAAKITEINKLVDDLKVEGTTDMAKVFQACSDNAGATIITAGASSSAQSFSAQQVATKTGEPYKKAMNALHAKLLKLQTDYEKALSIKNEARAKDKKEKPQK